MQAAKPKRKLRAKPGISEKLPKPVPVEQPVIPVPLEAPPPLPEDSVAKERWQPSPEELHAVFRDYMTSNKKRGRDLRIGMYRQWLTT